MKTKAQISKREMTVHHYFKTGQSIRNISRTLNVSSSAVAKTIKHYDETGSHEDLHWKGSPRVTSAAEDTFIRVTSLRNCSPNKCFTELR
jgi:transposase